MIATPPVGKSGPKTIFNNFESDTSGFFINSIKALFNSNIKEQKSYENYK